MGKKDAHPKVAPDDGGQSSKARAKPGGGGPDRLLRAAWCCCAFGMPLLLIYAKFVRPDRKASYVQKATGGGDGNGGGAAPPKKKKRKNKKRRKKRSDDGGGKAGALRRKLVRALGAALGKCVPPLRRAAEAATAHDAELAAAAAARAAKRAKKGGGATDGSEDGDGGGDASDDESDDDSDDEAAALRGETNELGGRFHGGRVRIRLADAYGGEGADDPETRRELVTALQARPLCYHACPVGVSGGHIRTRRGALLRRALM